MNTTSPAPRTADRAELSKQKHQEELGLEAALPSLTAPTILAKQRQKQAQALPEPFTPLCLPTSPASSHSAQMDL